MKLTISITLALSLTNMSGICGLSGSGVGGVASPLDTGAAQIQSENQQLIYQQQAEETEQREEEAALRRQQQAEAEALRQQQIQDRLNELKQDSNQKADAARVSNETSDRLKADFIEAKRQIPEDAWRDFGGVIKYVKSPDFNFVTFQGQILQTTSNGIRVNGKIGSNSQIEFFVKNFPHKFDDETLIGTDKKYVAVEDGQFTYLNISGNICSIQQLDYGVPCIRPKNADAIETAALNLTPSEEKAINDAKLEANMKQAEANLAEENLQVFLQKIEDDNNRATLAKQSALAKVVKWNQEQADKGDSYGLLRMGERYRDGDGVNRDLKKAREYLTKAANAGSATGADELSKLNQTSAAIKEK
jgi:hypothetical protein